MSRNDANDDDASRDRTDDIWMFDRRRALQLGGAGIAGLGFLGGGAGVASAATNCADGPFERAYTGGSVVFSEIPSPEGQSQAAATAMDAMPTRSAYSEPLTDAEREAVKRRGEPPNAQRADRTTGRADAAKAAAKRPEATEGGIDIGTEYDGLNAEDTRGGVPSDSQIATGSEYNLHAVNQQVGIFGKESGDLELQVRLEDIWEPVIPTPEGGFVGNDYPFVFDPRARYDRNEDRYILCAVQSLQGIDENGNVITREEIEEGADGPGFRDDEGGEGEDGEGGEGGNSGSNQPAPRPPKGFFVVAVSATSDPTGEWYVYRLPPEDADGPDNLGLVDYPQLGFDTDAVYLTQNFFPYEDDPNQSVRPTIVSLDKAQLYDGEAVTAYHFDNLDNPTDSYMDFTVQPASQPFSGGSDGTHYFMNSVFRRSMDTPLATTLTQWELTDPTDDPTLRCFTVEVDPYTGPPSADQPDSDANIDTIGLRLMNLDYNTETGSLWAAHAVAVSWDGVTIRSAIRWYEVNASARSQVQSGTYGEPEESYYIPTVNSDGDSTMMVHNVSGPNTFPRMDAAGRTRDFSQNVLEDAVVVQDGETRYDYGEGMPVMRWGDYNGVSVDPETGKYWGVSQYSPDINIDPARETRDPYHTRVAELSFDANGDGGTDAEANVLTIRGTGSRAEYTFSVTDTLEKSTANGANRNDNDEIRRGYVGDGVVGVSADSYTFEGKLETIAVDGDAAVSLDGDQLSDDEIADMPNNVIEVEGSGDAAEYAVAAADTDDPLRKVTANDANINGNDKVWRTTGKGVVGVSKDAYGFDGTIDSLNVDGDADVFVNGRPADDATRDHVVTVVGTGDAASYEFTVGGGLEKSTANFANINGNDTVSGTAASGVVGVSSDSYVYNGDISGFAADGDVRVFVDGERID